MAPAPDSFGSHRGLGSCSPHFRRVRAVALRLATGESSAVTRTHDETRRSGTPFQFDLLRTPASTILFLLGVALTFAPLLMMPLQLARAPSAPTVAIWFLISGTCATLWALAGSTKKWIFFIAAPVQLLAGLAVGNPWLGPYSLGPSSLDVLGLISMLCIGAGYACFVTFIVVHGKRAMTLSVEMNLASKIHRHLVPDIELSTDRFEVSARSRASGVMGGDIVHAATLPDGSIEAIVADVSGHGVRAGVVMAMVRGAIESHRARRTAEGGSTLDGRGTIEDGRLLVTSLAHELNRVLVRLTEPDMFVTAAIVHVAPSGDYHALVAAHPPVFLRSAKAGAGGAPTGGLPSVTPIGGAGLPLGVIDEVEATLSTGLLERGDGLVLYSDGLTEARVGSAHAPRESARATAALLGVDGLASIVSTMPAAPRDAVTSILAEVERASASKAPEDDQSILIVRRR